MPDKNEKLTELRSTQSKLRKQLREKRADRLVATEPSDQDALDKQIDALNEQIDTLSDQITHGSLILKVSSPEWRASVEYTADGKPSKAMMRSCKVERVVTW